MTFIHKGIKSNILLTRDITFDGCIATTNSTSSAPFIRQQMVNKPADSKIFHSKDFLAVLTQWSSCQLGPQATLVHICGRVRGGIIALTLAGNFTVAELYFNYKIVLDYSCCFFPPHSLNNFFTGWLVNIGFLLRPSL